MWDLDSAHVDLKGFLSVSFRDRELSFFFSFSHLLIVPT